PWELPASSKTMPLQAKPAHARNAVALSAPVDRQKRQRTRTSFRLDPGLPDNRAPTGLFLAHERIEVGGAAAYGVGDVGSLVGKVFADIRHGKNLDELSVETLNDRRRRACRGDDAVPERDVHPVVTELGERRQIGKQTMTLAACRR